jgi:hypothetical protein
MSKILILICAVSVACLSGCAIQPGYGGYYQQQAFPSTQLGGSSYYNGNDGGGWGDSGYSDNGYGDGYHEDH